MSRPAPSAWTAAAPAVLLLAACGGGPAGMPIPAPDLTRVEAGVAEHLGARRAAVETAPGDAEAWGLYGMALDVHGLLEEARLSYARAAELDPDDPRWPYLRAAAWPTGAPAVVIPLLERASELAPGGGPVHQALGEQLLRAGRLDEADAAFRVVAGNEPTRAHGLVGRARVALRGGRAAEARGLLERAARGRAPRREIEALLAQICVALGDRDAASRHAAAAARAESVRFPDPIRARVEAEGRSAAHLAMRGARLLDQGRAADAVSPLRAALAGNPDDPDVALRLGQALVLSGSPGEGLAILRETVADHPDAVAARRTLTAVLAATGHNGEAIAQCRIVLDTVPEDTSLRLRCAALLASSGRVAEAEALLETGLAHTGDPALSAALAELR